MQKNIKITQNQLTKVINTLLIESSEDSHDYVNGIKSGNQKVITKYYEHYYKLLMPKLKALTNKLSDQELNQILSDTLMRGITKIEHYSGTGTFDGWLYIMMKRMFLNHIKTHKKESENKLVPVDYVGDVPVNDGDTEFQKDLMAKFKIFLETQTPLIKKTAELYLGGYSHNEIGQIFGKTDGTSKWQVNSVMTKFKRWLADNNNL